MDTLSSDSFFCMVAGIPVPISCGTEFLKRGNTREKNELRLSSYKVRLRIDEECHTLFWILDDPQKHAQLMQMNIANYVFLQDIVDVRKGTGPYELSMTVVAGTDFTNLEFHEFVCLAKDDQHLLGTWSNFLFSKSLEVRRSFHGLLYHMQKILAPVIQTTKHTTKPGTEITVTMEKISSVFVAAKHSSEHKQFVQLLSTFTKNGYVRIHKLENPKQLLNYILRIEGFAAPLQKIYKEIGGTDLQLDKLRLLKFIQTTQRDDRLNEAIYPKIKMSNLNRQLKSLGYGENDLITFPVFVHYMISDWNTDVSGLRYLETDDMTRPMTSYYCNSSHNTYCSGMQVNVSLIKTLSNSQQHKTALAEIEIYRQVLLSGCRCIELDTWEGSCGGPIVTHGPRAFMKMNELPLRDVCEAINETAFKTTPFPVVLSIENHLKLSLQKEMVAIFREVFGEKLLDEPLEEYPLDPGVEPPSPTELKYKILIKARKSKPEVSPRQSNGSSSTLSTLSKATGSCTTLDSQQSVDGLDSPGTIRPDRLEVISLFSTEEFTEIKSWSPEERENLNPPKEEASSSYLSQIVNYFSTWKTPKLWIDKDELYYVMSSLKEEEVSNLAKNEKDAKRVVRFNSKRTMRVYPSNYRVDSSNYDPLMCWYLGAQMLALNFQTNCLQMQLNHCLFEMNGACGYVKKPKQLLDPSMNFSIHTAKLSVQQSVPVKLRIKVISAHFLSSLLSPDNTEMLHTSVQVEVMDVSRTRAEITKEAMSNIRIQSTRMSVEKETCTTYDEAKMTFGKILLPDMAFVRFAVRRKEGCNFTEIAQRILPVDKINNGYRYVILRSDGNRNLGPAVLFVHIQTIYDNLRSEEKLGAELADPFAIDRRNAEFAAALLDPFANNFNVRRKSEEPLSSPSATSPTSRNRDEIKKGPLAAVKCYFNRLKET